MTTPSAGPSGPPPSELKYYPKSQGKPDLGAVVFVLGKQIPTARPRLNAVAHPRLTGPPGSWKGSLCRRLATDPELNAIHGRPVLHFCVGDVLRKLLAEGSLSAKQRNQVESQRFATRNEQFINGDEFAALIGPELKKTNLAGHVVVFDGFPRNLSQMRAFHQHVRLDTRANLAQQGIDRPLTIQKLGSLGFVISLQCTRVIAQERYFEGWKYFNYSHQNKYVDVFQKSEELFWQDFALFEIENAKIVKNHKVLRESHMVEVNTEYTLMSERVAKDERRMRCLRPTLYTPQPLVTERLLTESP